MTVIGPWLLERNGPLIRSHRVSYYRRSGSLYYTLHLRFEAVSTVYIKAAAKARRIFGMVRRNFNRLDKEDFLVTYTRSSADADNGLDAFVGQSRSTNISGPFLVK